MGTVEASTDMLQIVEGIDAENAPEKVKEFAKYAQLILSDIVRQINGEIDVRENLATSFKTVSFTAANTNKAVAHGLGRAPAGYIHAGSTVSLNVYDGSGITDTVNISLKSTAVGDVKLLFF